MHGHVFSCIAAILTNHSYVGIVCYHNYLRMVVVKQCNVLSDCQQVYQEVDNVAIGFRI